VGTSPRDWPVTGDWDGESDETIGAVRGSGWFLRDTNTTGDADLAFPFTP
jgi:hypothetical protein